MLILEAHFESMLAVNLGEIIIDLNRGADFVGWQESIAAKGLQTVDSECRQTAVLFVLRDAQNTELRRKTCQIIGFGNVASCVKIIQAYAGDVDGGGRNSMS